MRVCLVIQSEAFLTSAGMRVRYNRLLQRGQDTVAIKTIAQLCESTQFDDDVYIFSKVFTTEALIAMAGLMRRGKVVGQDLFDDYFSQSSDSRLARFRRWFNAAAPATRFIICTTAAMRDVVLRQLPTMPVTVIEDPVADIDWAALSEAAERKARDAIASRRLSILWFGIGDNPFFPVGIRDLVGQRGALTELQRRGWAVDLLVLTNIRALSADGLRRLQDLGVPYRLEEWSEEREASALRDSFAAFIPVNAQSFSRAKSLNRCLTALTLGAQVLSAGHDLYHTLHPFIYRAPEDLAADLETGTLRLGHHALDAFRMMITAQADRERNAEAFFQTIREAAERKRPPKKTLCVLHGTGSPSSVHKLANRFGGLSIGLPISAGRLNFDLRFDLEAGDIRVRISARGIKMARPESLAGAKPAGKILDLEFIEVPPAVVASARKMPIAALTGNREAKLAAYPTLVAYAAEVCERLFPNAHLVISEADELSLVVTETIPRVAAAAA